MLPVFAYGTLKPDEPAYLHYCEPYLLQAQPACMRGELFHLPQGYPAMTSGDRWITGTVLVLADAQAIARIDEFEDYDPARVASVNLYQRLERPVFSMSRQPLGTAWVYLMAPPQVAALDGVRVTSGTWSHRHFSNQRPAIGG